MNTDQKREYEKLYWKDVEREEINNQDDGFSLEMVDYCAVYAKKGCTSCPHKSPLCEDKL